MEPSEMFIDIHEPAALVFGHSVICRRCGALIVHLDRLNLVELHDRWHQRNDHGDTVDLGASPL